MQVTLSNGENYLIEPLTLEQVDALTDAPPPDQDLKAARTAGRQSCVDALNNATPGSWSLEKLRSEFTMPLFNELGAEVMKISGLAPLGEAEASL